MRVWLSVWLCACVSLLPLLATAQVSTVVIEASLDEQVRVEFIDGSIVEGLLIRADEDSFVVRTATGRLVEHAHGDVLNVYLLDNSSPTAPTAPPVPSVSYDDYLVANADFSAGSRMTTLGRVLMITSAVTFIVGVSTADNSPIECLWRHDRPTNKCERQTRRFGYTMLALTPVVLSTGFVLSLRGKQRMERSFPTVDAYRLQEHRERMQERRDLRSSGETPRTELLLTPMLARGGGGAHVRLTF